jgi:flagellar biosynthesis protein
MTKNRDLPTPKTRFFQDRAIAVAIKGEKGSARPPTILASGQGVLAEQILQLAFTHGVKVREDADLAGLLATLDLETEIPPDILMVVAEILTRVYEENKKAEPLLP